MGDSFLPGLLFLFSQEKLFAGAVETAGGNKNSFPENTPSDLRPIK